MFVWGYIGECIYSWEWKEVGRDGVFCYINRDCVDGSILDLEFLLYINDGVGGMYMR